MSSFFKKTIILTVCTAIAALVHANPVPVQAQQSSQSGQNTEIRRTIIEETAPETPEGQKSQSGRKAMYAVLALALVAVAGYFGQKLWREEKLNQK